MEELAEQEVLHHMSNTSDTVSAEEKSHSSALDSQSSSSQEDTDASENTSDDLQTHSSTKLEYKNHLKECIPYKNELETKCNQLTDKCKDLETRLEMTLKRYNLVVKDKDMMVMKYAVSEKSILDVKAEKDQVEKKFKEVVKENEILQHKVTSMGSEKSRICQMLDNKCYDFKCCQQELEKVKADYGMLETKLKWAQNNLKTESDLRKEADQKIESLSSKLQETINQIDQTKQEAVDSIRNFHHSQENRANILDQQLKEQQANLILSRHEISDKEKQIKNLQTEFERLQSKQKDTLDENNTLSLKVQNLEKERLEIEQKFSELKGYSDQQKQDSADLMATSAKLEQLKLQLSNKEKLLLACNEQVSLFKQRNSELEQDMDSCREREAEMLLFTQQLTDKNVRLQSEFTAMETKVQQLTCEQSIFKRATKEQETKVEILSNQLTEDRTKHIEEITKLSSDLTDKTKLCDTLIQEVSDQKGENNVIKRKYERSLKEVNKELQQVRKRIEEYESSSISSNSSNASVTNDSPLSNATPAEQVKVIQPDTGVDRQTLIEHIVKLQRISARKSEKIDFLEEHVNTLVCELQRKARLLQNYIIREQSGTMTSNKMDSNKANLAKLSGVMASMYGSRIADNNLTLELSLDINKKLQAVLEDALLKNITLKENVDTLGAEIERLNNLLKTKHTT